MITHRDLVEIAFNEWWDDHKYEFGQIPRMIDVGTGHKKLKSFFEKKGFEWHGIDIAGGSNGIIKGDMSNMDMIDDGVFDLVFCCHAFEHCERPIDALREFKRILKPGGWAFIATPNPTKRHILEKDQDHIFCLNEWQMKRLLLYTDWDKIHTEMHKADDWDHNWNVISVGQK